MPPEQKIFKFIEDSSIQHANQGIEELFFSESKKHSLTQLDLSAASRLKHLTLISCYSLKHINFPIVSNLEELIINFEPDGSPLESVSVKEQQISHLDLSSCPNLKKLELNHLIYLKQIDLSQLQNIEELTIDKCDLSKLDLQHCLKLKKLQIKNCENLSEIELPPNIETLIVDDCNFSVLDLKKCQMLKTLQISHCSKLKSLRLSTNIKSLYISNCELNDLDLRQCHQLKDVKFTYAHFNQIQFAPNIETIEILGMRQTCPTMNFDACNNLKSINVESSGKDILAAYYYTNTKSLERYSINNYQVAGGIYKLNFSAIKEFEINLAKFEKLIAENLPDLENMSIRNCLDLSGLDLSASSKIKQLKIKNSEEYREGIKTLNFKKLATVPQLYTDYMDNSIAKGLQDCLKLNSLEIADAQHEINLSRLVALEEVDITRSKKLSKITFDNCEKLKNIKLSCENLETANFVQLPNLENLSINILNDQIISDLQKCQKLKQLNVSSQGYKVLNTKTTIFEKFNNVESINIAGSIKSTSLNLLDCLIINKNSQMKTKS